MNNQDWVTFFALCNEILGKGSYTTLYSENWCSWTTFDRLERDAGYWTSGLPNMHEIDECGVDDGGNWGQPFLFNDIAHLIIPHKFLRWGSIDGETICEYIHQNIFALSEKLKSLGIEHVISKWALELKLF